ncbi:MAG: hypothetical protein R3Y19_05830 [Rikenellaceae bacterium]
MKNTDYNSLAASALHGRNQVGTISKLYGTSGELVVKLWDTFPVDNTQEPLWVEIDSLAVPLFISSFETQGLSKAVIIFDDFGSEKLSSMLVGLPIYSLVCENVEQDADDMPLLGMSFKDTTSGRCGTVVGFIDSEFNPLLELEIEGDDQEYLVPFNEEFVVDIKKRKREIVFALPESIFDLNL